MLNQVPNRTSLTVVTPYHPLEVHYHAAEELMLPALRELARHYEITVIAPEPHPDRLRPGDGIPNGLRFLTVPRPAQRFTRLLGVYPAGARKDWTRRMSVQARALVGMAGSDRLHIEYLQPAEVGLVCGLPFTLTLHDLGSDVYAQRVRTSRHLVERAYRYLEWLRVSRLEARVLRSACAVICLSDRDAAALQAKGVPAAAVRVGVASPGVVWDPAPVDRPIAVFAGALWRDANSATAKWLLTEVWPSVLERWPNARLKIVGKGSPDWLSKLANRTANAWLVGEVASIAAEYARAQLVLAPSLLDAGILLKALTAMAVGAPVVLNTQSAAPIGATAGIDAFIADGPDEYAQTIVAALGDWPHTVGVGRAGHLHVERHFSWAAYADSMKGVIG